MNAEAKPEIQRIKSTATKSLRRPAGIEEMRVDRIEAIHSINPSFAIASININKAEKKANVPNQK